MTVRSKKSINCQSAFPFSIFKLKSRSSASNFSKFYCRVKKKKKKKKKKHKKEKGRRPAFLNRSFEVSIWLR